MPWLLRSKKPRKGRQPISMGESNLGRTRRGPRRVGRQVVDGWDHIDSDAEAAASGGEWERAWKAEKELATSALDNNAILFACARDVQDATEVDGKAMKTSRTYLWPTFIYGWVQPHENISFDQGSCVSCYGTMKITTMASIV